MTVDLRAAPASAFSRDLLVREDGVETRLSGRGLRQRGTVELDGETYRFGPEGWRSGLRLERERDGYVLARAKRAGLLSGRQVVTLSDRRLELVSRGFWRRRWVVTHGDREVGTLRSTGFFDRTLEASLDDGIVRPVRFFLLYVVIVIKRRQAAAAAAAG